MPAKLPNRRIRLLLVVFAFAFLAMFVRAAWLQGVRAQDLGRMAQSQQRVTTVDPGSRGTIYDRQGIQLAIGRQATTVYANPQQIDDPELVAAVVARTLRLDPKEVERLLSDKSKGFVYIARKADAKRAKLLEQQNIVGLGYLPEEQRVYPQRHVASQVLGYAGTDNRGLAGLELALDPVLRGRPGRETVVRDPAGRAISILSSTAAEQGQDVYLTHRPHAAGERRGRAPPDDPALGGGGGERRRPRSAQRRHPRDGRRARLRREPLPDRAEGPATEPRRHGHLRAGLDVQGRDRQRGALGGARLAFHCVHAPLRDPGRRPRRSTTRTSAARSG